MPPAVRDASAPVTRAWPLLLIAVAAAYLGLVYPILARNHFDVSAFILAGDMHVDAAKLPAPIIVIPQSAGYDGEFYYRLALSPFGLQPTEFGIRFDAPAFRMQRIVYPLLARTLALGRPAWVPAALFAVNLLGLCAIAASAWRLTARLRLPPWTPLAILLWPGFFITLTHDTTEIVAAALLLGAIECHVANRLPAYAALAALATLTRETSILFAAGVLCFEIFHLLRDRRGWRRVLVCGAALVPFVAWQQALVLMWGEAPRSAGVAQNLCWPLVGAFTMLREVAIGVRHYAALLWVDQAIRVFVAATTIWLLLFCAAVATRVPAALRLAGAGAVAAGWLPLAGLMSVLAADGPWINPGGYFRAFTECYVVGCLVPPRSRGWVGVVWLVVVLGAFAGGWVLRVGER